jgi:DNA-binding response OmpR family regulator
MRVAILEDDPLLSDLLCAILQAEAHDCHPVRDGRAMLKRLREESFDLLLLDWNVPDPSGLDVLKWSRANLDPCPPSIMVTRRDAEADIVAALNAGADDYIAKPFAPGVVAARVGAVLRRSYSPPSAERVEEFAGARCDHDAQTVTLAGRTVELTAKEFALAVMLLRNLQRPLSRAHLLEAVWGRNPDLSTRTLDVHVSKIRTKLGLVPENGFLLVPVYSFGYRLKQVAPATAPA